jgi:hypothetical protein
MTVTDEVVGTTKTVGCCIRTGAVSTVVRVTSIGADTIGASVLVVVTDI